MRHYEIVCLVHPDQSEQVPAMVDKYRALVKKHRGKVYRVEDWGRRSLAYRIKRVHKAHYLLINIGGELELIKEIRSAFDYNDAVLRYMITRVNEAETGVSVMMEKVRRERKREPERSKPGVANGDASGSTGSDDTGGDSVRSKEPVAASTATDVSAEEQNV